MTMRHGPPPEPVDDFAERHAAFHDFIAKSQNGGSCCCGYSSDGSADVLRIEVRRVANGCVVTFDGDSYSEIVYQERGAEVESVNAWAEMLDVITQHYGPQTSRYSPARVIISVEPGDKWENGQCS